MIHRIPVLKTYISLISSNSLRSLQRVEGTVLDGCRLLKNTTKSGVGWKDQERTEFIRCWTTAMAGGGTQGCHCCRREPTRHKAGQSLEKGIKCHHRRQEAHLKLIPSTGEAFLEKYYDCIKGDTKNDQKLVILSPKKANEKLGGVDLTKQLKTRGGMKPNTNKGDTARIKQKISSSCFTARKHGKQGDMSTHTNSPPTLIAAGSFP